MSFSARLRRAIRQKGMSEAAFARAIDMSPTYLSRILNDEAYRPEPETVRRYADGLGMPVEELATWTDIPLALGLGGDGTAPSPSLSLVDNGEDPIDAALIIAYVESRPGERFRAQVAAVKARLAPEKYERWCVSLFRAWASNARMALEAIELSENP